MNKTSMSNIMSPLLTKGSGFGWSQTPAMKPNVTSVDVGKASTEGHESGLSMQPDVQRVTLANK